MDLDHVRHGRAEQLLKRQDAELQSNDLFLAQTV